MEEQMGKMREDADILTQPKFSPTDTEETMHDATKEAIESVKLSIQHLNSIYQQLITMCQQKRDLFIVCVKFHLTTRQVKAWCILINCMWFNLINADLLYVCLSYVCTCNMCM